MSDDPSCQAPHAPTGAVPRTCVPFAHVPAVPVVAVPYVPVPVPAGLPVLSVSGVFPDRTGNVDVSQFLSSWAGEFAAAKADKVVPAAAGNLASLDSSGNLADSGATPASIKAAAVAEVVANAPGAMDTLKEIADILGSPQQSGTVLKRISDLEDGKADSSSLAAVATSGSYDDLSDRPEIPAPVTIDSALSSTSENPVQNKAVAAALYTGFTEWEISGIPEVVKSEYDLIYLSWNDMDEVWDLNFQKGMASWSYSEDGSIDDTYLVFTNVYDDKSGVTFTATATRHLITPTKTSQLTNDGAPNGGGTPYATIAQIPTVPSAYTSTPAMDGAGSAGSSTAWARGDHVHPTDTSRAAASDLPYRLVEPGEWEFSGGVSGYKIVGLSFEDNSNEWIATWESDDESQSGDYNFYGTGEELSLTFTIGSIGGTWTATRASLPGHLLDRAGNRVVVSGDTTLTLPAAVAGYARDFLVRLEISGSTVPTITFAAPTGETITYETDGDEFPVPDEAGDWLYSFTESCVAHKFAVSLKKVNTVAAPQAQGGA